MFAGRSGEQRVVGVAPFDTHELPGEGEVWIGLRFCHRELIVPAGQQIKLSNTQIAELCMYYKIICDKTIECYRAFLREKGVPSVKKETNATSD